MSRRKIAGPHKIPIPRGTMWTIKLIACASLCFSPQLAECGGTRGLRRNGARRLTEDGLAANEVATESSTSDPLESPPRIETPSVAEQEGQSNVEEISTVNTSETSHEALPPPSVEQTIALSEVHLPSNIENGFVDIRRPFDKTISTPFFWHIPKTGGHPVKGYLSECMQLVEALEVGGQGEHAEDTILEIVSEPSGFKYVNVDSFSRPGLAKAKEMGLGQSKLADVIFTMWPHEGSDLFEGEQKGAIFALFRHPIQRAKSMFHNLLERREDLHSMTLVEFAQSEYVEENWMVRMLLNKMSGPLEPGDLDIAKRIVHEKIIVGLTSKMAESYIQFDQYFKWQPVVPDMVDCREVYASMGNNYNRDVAEGSEEWDLLLEHNRLDMELYSFIEDLFHNDQAARLFGSDLKQS